MSLLVIPEHDRSLYLAVFELRALDPLAKQSIGPLTHLKEADSSGRLYESYLKYSLKFVERDKAMKSLVLDHFVRREVARRLKEEEALASIDELVYRLPFKMKVQNLLEDNKAMDEWTKEDKERMEKEANKEIERNFPSYFDEF